MWPVLRPLLAAAVLSGFPAVRGQTTLVVDHQPQAVILTAPSPRGYVTLAAQELQKHLQLISGATLPIDIVGHESRYSGRTFVYVGSSSASAAAGITTTGLSPEYYVIKTVGSNLYIVGRDAGKDDWTDLSNCQPGTLFGVYHFLGEVLHVRWLWPGDSGIVTPAMASVSVPSLDITSGPAMVMRKYRTPRIGLYTSGATTYGSNGMSIPVLPTSGTERIALANQEALWLRRMQMGTRKDTSFGHSETTWWSMYGKSHPEYFAVLLPGKSQPSPQADEVKLNISHADVQAQIINNWIAAGKPNSLNICPNDSRSFCVCPDCLAWDSPSQPANIVFNDSSAQLGDRYARFYTAIATQVSALNPNATVYGYAYDTYKNAPYVATVPANVALEYIPGAPADVVPSQIAETQSNVLGWIAHGCTQMYLRPNWFLAAHAGPFAPIHRAGDHFRAMLAGGYLLGLDSDSSASGYAGFGLYYYLFCRLMADPTLTPDQIIEEYCSGFGSAAARIHDYFAYWEAMIDAQADSGDTSILGWSSGMAAYPKAYTDATFDGAEQILDDAAAMLAPGETAARARIAFLRVACTHGRLTAHAIALVDPNKTLAGNPAAEAAMRALLAFRDTYADSFALWREWLIDRESYGVPGMHNYWTAILANPTPAPPVFVSGSSAAGAATVPFNFQLVATNATTNYSATGLPPGLSLDPTTGLISGTAPNAGVANVTVTATNIRGTTSSPLTITIGALPSAPVIIAQPASQTMGENDRAVFRVTASGAVSYQWLLDGLAVPGATDAAIVTTIAGTYTCELRNAAAATVSQPAQLTITADTNVGRLVNMSVLTAAGDKHVLTVGFVTGGAGTQGMQALLLRATGPALEPFGVSGVLADPQLTLFSQSTAIASNDNWGVPPAGQSAITTADAATGAFALTDPGSLDSALVASLAPGLYSMEVSGRGSGPGQALAEVYDYTPSYSAAAPRLINLSSMTSVASGGRLAAGFAIGGNSALTVLIRATGPALMPFGVADTMPDPTIKLYHGQAVIGANAGWAGDPVVKTLSGLVGAFDLPSATSLDSALVETLPPGVYSVQCSSASGAPGTALIEVYEVR